MISYIELEFPSTPNLIPFSLTRKRISYALQAPFGHTHKYSPHLCLQKRKACKQNTTCQLTSSHTHLHPPSPSPHKEVEMTFTLISHLHTQTPPTPYPPTLMGIPQKMGIHSTVTPKETTLLPILRETPPFPNSVPGPLMTTNASLLRPMLCKFPPFLTFYVTLKGRMAMEQL